MKIELRSMLTQLTMADHGTLYLETLKCVVSLSESSEGLVSTLKVLLLHKVIMMANTTITVHLPSGN